MNDPVLGQILFTAFKYGVGGSLVGVGLRFFSRGQPGPRLDQSAAVGFLIGAAWGAFIGVFQSMLVRP